MTKLIASKENVYLSRELARIDKNVPSLPALCDVEYKGVDSAALYDMFRKLDFSGFIKRFGLGETAEVADKAPEVPEVKEASAGDVDRSTVYGCSIDFENDRIYLSCDEKLLCINGIAQSKNLLCGGARLVCYDVKETCHRLEKYSIDFSSCIDDVMLMGYVCMGGAGDTSLAKLVSRYLSKRHGVGSALYICTLRCFCRRA